MLQDALKKLEESINVKMDEFTLLARCAQKLSKHNVPDEEVAEFYQEMGVILAELDPVREIVERQNPHLVELFDKVRKYTQKKD